MPQGYFLYARRGAERSLAGAAAVGQKAAAHAGGAGACKPKRRAAGPGKLRCGAIKGVPNGGCGGFFGEISSICDRPRKK